MEERKYQKDDVLTRKDVKAQYNLTEKESIKLFKRLDDKIIKLGKAHKISRKTLEEELQKGIC